MNSPDPGFEKQKLHELVSAVLDGTAVEDQRRELTEQLRESPAARDEYLRLVDLHATLATDIAPTTSSEQSSKNEKRTVTRRSWLPIAATAILLASSFVAIFWFSADDTDIKLDSFATISQATNAVWESDQFDVGRRIGPVKMQLKSGLVQIEFDSGVEVTLEGPAEFELVDAVKTELRTGVLTATVPAGAEGFTVDTPSAQVIDLGTAFGIDLSDESFASVSVFEGEVEVVPRETVKKHLLSEGEAVRIGTNHEIETIRFDAKPFEKIWPFASGIVGSTETIRFVPPWPKKIRLVKSDEQIFLRPEGRKIKLQTELKVNISEPSDCVESSDLTPSVLEAGKTVRSYMLHFSPESQLGRKATKRVTGSITFDRPVVGLIVQHAELLASRHRFGRRGAGEANQRRELNFTSDETGDRVSLSPDRKTVTLDLISPGRSSDLVRIIVASGRRSKETETQ